MRLSLRRGETLAGAVVAAAAPELSSATLLFATGVLAIVRASMTEAPASGVEALSLSLLGRGTKAPGFTTPAALTTVLVGNAGLWPGCSPNIVRFRGLAVAVAVGAGGRAEALAIRCAPGDLLAAAIGIVVRLLAEGAGSDAGAPASEAAPPPEAVSNEPSGPGAVGAGSRGGPKSPPFSFAFDGALEGGLE